MPRLPRGIIILATVHVVLLIFLLKSVGSSIAFLYLISSLLSLSRFLYTCIFLSTGIQRPDGRFILPTDGPVPQYSEQPGTIRYENNSLVLSKHKNFHIIPKHFY